MNIIHKGQRLSKLKTSTKKGTCNPIFNELFEIDLSSMNLEVEDLQLDLFVMNYDRLGHNTVMGGVLFGDHVMHKSGQSHWKKAMIETNSNVTMWHPLTLFPQVSASRSGSRSASPSPTHGHHPSSPFRGAAQGCFSVTSSGYGTKL